MSRRLERLTARLHEEISRIVMYELSDPRMGFVTITGVKLAEDLKTASVSLSVLGEPDAQEQTLRALHHARGHVQRLLQDRVEMRRTPILSFRVDPGVKNSVRMSAILRTLARERAEREGESAAESEGTGPDEDVAASAEEDSGS